MSKGGGRVKGLGLCCNNRVTRGAVKYGAWERTQALHGWPNGPNWPHGSWWSEFADGTFISKAVRFLLQDLMALPKNDPEGKAEYKLYRCTGCINQLVFSMQKYSFVSVEFQ